jgi:uncharacterized membrane protein YeaQ/YmgE (transglycosylase-associated protein family)
MFTFFGLMGLILFGLVVGAIAKLVMPGKDPGGLIVTILLGIVGALLGSWIGRTTGLYGPDALAGFFMALLGSIILLAAYRFTIGARGRPASTR